MKAVIDFARINLGRFLEACGHALQAPMPAMGELTKTWMHPESIGRTFLPSRMLLKLRATGAAGLNDVVYELPNGEKMHCHEMVIRSITIEADIHPVERNGMLEYFTIEKPPSDTPLALRDESHCVDHWVNPITGQCAHCGRS